MVSADNRHNGVRKANSLQNLRSNHGMNLHLLELFRRQPSGLRDDMFRDRQLADIMQKSRGMQSFQFSPGHAQFFRDFDSINPDALQVIVGGLVFSFDSQRQGLNGSQMQVRDLLHMQR